jgi:glyoxylase-like metal-dependent hydrolase (beta-lactamase superfamily II)
VRVTALGTGDALCGGGRGSTAWLVDDERGSYCVDFGPTAPLALRKLDRRPDELDAVLFTHLHGDHFAGWPFLLLASGQRTRPLAAVGPPGTRERLQAIWQICYADTAERELPFEVRVTEVQPGETIALLGRTLSAFWARHMGPKHVALSLRVDDVAFTGDTGAIAPGLCDGARVLCCECTEARPGNAKHLDWDTLERLLPDVPLVLVGHLGEEARRLAKSRNALRICDDLDSVEL